MQIIIQIRRQNTIDMMHIWIRIGLVDSESAHSQTRFEMQIMINHSIFRLFYPDQPIFFVFDPSFRLEETKNHWLKF